jgi:hypothetical protein
LHRKRDLIVNQPFKMKTAVVLAIAGVATAAAPRDLGGFALFKEWAFWAFSDYACDVENGDLGPHLELRVNRD